MPKCEECGEWCGDDYDLCKGCNDEPILIEFDTVVRKTDAAVLIRIGDLFDNEQVWLPKSLIELDEDGEVWMPRWLADEKEL